MIGGGKECLVITHAADTDYILVINICKYINYNIFTYSIQITIQEIYNIFCYNSIIGILAHIWMIAFNHKWHGEKQIIYASNIMCVLRKIFMHKINIIAHLIHEIIFLLFYETKISNANHNSN